MKQHRDIDQSILITGCSSGIGLRCAQLFKDAGYTVFATARQASDVAILKSQGFEHALQFDVCNYQQMSEVLTYIQKNNNNTLGVLFNNAGYSQVGVAEDLSLDALKEQFETNFFAVCELTRQVLALMHETGSGQIFMNSSVFGLASSAFRGAYCASKYALEAYTDSLRMELALLGSNIGVSLIEPGPVVSNIRQNKKIYFEKHIDAENSRYKDFYQNIHNGLAMSGKIPFTVEPDVVYNILRQAIRSKKPKPRYYVTKLTYIVGYLKRLLSSKAIDSFTLNVLSKKEIKLASNPKK